MNSRGASLVEVIVASLIVAIVALGLASVFSANVRQASLLRGKLDALELETQLVRYMAAPNFCSCVFQSTTFSIVGVKATPTGVVTSISNSYTNNCVKNGGDFVKVGELLSGTQLRVNQMQLGEMTEVVENTGIYSGYFYVKFDQNVDKKGPGELRIPIILRLDSGTPSASRSLLGCIKNSEVACIPGSITKSVCPTINNGVSVATCGPTGVFGSCTSDCLAGYVSSGTQPNITCSK